MAALEQHLTILHNDRDNTHLLTRDKQLRLDLVNLKFAKKCSMLKNLNVISLRNMIGLAFFMLC